MLAGRRCAAAAVCAVCCMLQKVVAHQNRDQMSRGVQRRYKSRVMVQSWLQPSHAQRQMRGQQGGRSTRSQRFQCNNCPQLFSREAQHTRCLGPASCRWAQPASGPAGCCPAAPRLAAAWPPAVAQGSRRHSAWPPMAAAAAAALCCAAHAPAAVGSTLRGSGGRNLHRYRAAACAGTNPGPARMCGRAAGGGQLARCRSQHGPAVEHM